MAMLDGSWLDYKVVRRCDVSNTSFVNNAGVGPENPAENVREEDFDLTVSVNVKGTFFASQAAGKVMIRQNMAASST